MIDHPVEPAQLLELLERLSNEFGPSGRERAVRSLLRTEVARLADHLDVDALGNLIAYKAGSGPAPRLRIMVSAHMDEVGFMIVRILKSGLLSFDAVGSPEIRTLPGKRVLVGDDRVPGVIGAFPPHLRREQSDKTADITDLSIDIGATDEKEASRSVSVGDYATFGTRFRQLSADPGWPTVLGKAFDDRAGCTALVALLAGNYPVDLVGVFTVQEEVGLRGARAAAFRVDPDAALALEGTICDDVPRPVGEETDPVTRLGDGPAVTLADRSLMAHPGLVNLCRAAAQESGVSIQYRTALMGGTDTGAIHLARAGVPATVVSIPCRYIHTPASILNLNDLQGAVRLVAAVLQRIEPASLAR